MIALPEHPTGADLANAIRTFARSSNRAPVAVAAALSPYPKSWLNQLEHALRPKPATIARVRALLAGEAVPPAPPNNFQKEKGPEALAARVARDAETASQRRAQAASFQSSNPLDLGRPQPAPIACADDDPRPPALSRESCPRCQSRGDLGCAHQRPYDARMFL